MSNSINTNVGAMVALRNLNNVSDALSTTNKRISTGYNVSDAYDDGASYAVAEGLRGDMAALNAVNERLSVGKGMIDVAVKAGENISKALTEVRTVLTKLADQAMTGADRTNYENQYNTLKNDIYNFINDAQYNNITLIGSGASNQSLISNVSGGNITVSAQDMMAKVYNSLTSASTYSAAATLIGTSGGLGAAETNLGISMNQLAADARRIGNQINFNKAISDATKTGMGAIVDADLAKESAMLQSLQVKQQLASQALSIANQAPQSLLGLFR
ncbi:flagellin [Arenibaculum pallidiluteum]|uniref:flagellin n=1 Tax=Arenibaculum pallidiluteum TaxID=2812559 RepID=UPI001A9633D8|nr:flagellin [Arenibaculum pallidiluteum]